MLEIPFLLVELVGLDDEILVNEARRLPDDEEADEDGDGDVDRPIVLQPGVGEEDKAADHAGYRQQDEQRLHHRRFGRSEAEDCAAP